jgi:hypothetical protein
MWYGQRCKSIYKNGYLVKNLYFCSFLKRIVR